MLQGPIVAALLAKAAIRQEPEAISLDQILLEQHLEKIFGGDAALEDILGARMRDYVGGFLELCQLLGRRLIGVCYFVD